MAASLSITQVLLRLGLPLVMVLAGIGGMFLLKSSDKASVPEAMAHPVVLSYDESTAATTGVDVPEGMTYVPGGKTVIGSEKGLPMEKPVFETEVAPFFMDTHPVTVAQFRTFVEATGYETQAESFGDAAVLNLETYAWMLLKGASWEYPLGPAGEKAEDNHPVTQVSWYDALAYSKWAGKRLPTEIEWEHAARGATAAPHQYAWGNVLYAEGVAKANTWEGSFPEYNSGDDGFLMTSPVGEFGKTPLGLTDMGGNVWEWTDSWYLSYEKRGQAYTPHEQSERVQRGGSFLCNPGYCHGYRVSARSHSTAESSLFHVGFRTVKDI
ncbi:MAG: formylglycine-generating enzyme family protein [Rhodothermales bacterium]